MAHEPCGSRSLVYPCPQTGASLRRHRRRPRRPDRRLPAGQGRASASSSSRPRTRSAAWPRPSSTPTATASTSAATASSPRTRRSTTSGSRSWATSSSCARACRGSSGAASSSTTRSTGTDVIKKLGPIELPLCRLSYLWAAIKPKGARGQPRAVGLQPLRQAPVQPLLQVLHREGVGRADAPSCAPSGRPSGSRACRSSAPPRPRSSATSGDKIKSLIGQFQYPRYGPGQMWEMMTGPHRGARRRGAARDAGDEARDGRRRRGRRRPHGGRGHRAAGRDLLAAAARDGRHRRAVGPAADVHEAAQGLRYRDFLTVALILDGEDLFPDNWIYIHEPGVQVGRIQNYRSWSPWMVPDPDTACVGLEYFCFEGDDLWTMSDDDLVALATRELEQLGLAPAGEGAPRLRRARPEGLSDVRRGLRRARRRIRAWLDPLRRPRSRSAATGCTATTTPTTRCSARCARSTTSCTGPSHDIWAVNVESAYHEEQTDADTEQPYRERSGAAARRCSRP